MSSKNIVALAVFFGILYAIGIAWGMPSEFVSEIDSEFPSGPFNVLAHLRDSGYTCNYPVFHKLLMLPLYGVVLLILKMTGNFSSFSSLWPYGFSDPAGAMTILILTARYVSLLMGVGIVCILGLMANRVCGNGTIRQRLMVFVPVIAFGLSGVVTYYSRSSNYDVPQLFWWALSFFSLWKFIFETARRRDLVLSALFGALAAATKDQTVFFIAGSSLLLFIFPSSDKFFGSKARTFLVYSLYAIGFYIAAAVLVQPYHWISHMKQVLFLNITSRQFAVYSGSIPGQISLFIECTKCLSHIMTPWGIIFSILSIAALVVKKKHMVLAAIGLPAIVAYFFIFARIHFVFERYLLNYAFLFTLAAIFGIRFVIDIPRSQWLKYHLCRTVASVIAGCWLLHQIIFGFVPLTWAQFHDTKKQLTGIITAIVPSGDTLSWQGSRFSLPNADVYSRYRFAVPDTAYSTIRSLRLGHMLVRSNEKRSWVLSDRDLFCRDSALLEITRRNWVDTAGLNLVAKVEDPSFVRNNINVYSAAFRALTFRVSIPYYLYRRKNY
jgi:hypothetical protein